MDVLILGQKKEFVLELKRACRGDCIHICEKEEEAEDVRLVIMDVLMDGIRDEKFAGIPFLVMSEDGRESIILKAFEAGAEDYIVYPVSPKVARARILRLLKQEREWAVDDKMKSLREEVHFTPNEYKIFSLMRKHPGKVFTRNELLEGAFLELYEGYDRNVDNYIKQIRKKLPEKEGKIETAYGVGYRFVM